MEISNTFLGTVPGYKVKIPIPVRVQRGEGIDGAVAVYDLIESFGQGDHISDALADLGKVIAEEYEVLSKRQGSLSDHLDFVFKVLELHIEPIPKPKICIYVGRERCVHAVWTAFLWASPYLRKGAKMIKYLLVAFACLFFAALSPLGSRGERAGIFAAGLSLGVAFGSNLDARRQKSSWRFDS